MDLSAAFQKAFAAIDEKASQLATADLGTDRDFA